MKNRKFIISLIAGILVAVLLLGLLSGIAPVFANAKSVSELENKVAQLEEQKEEAADKIAQLRAQLSDNSDEIEAISQKKSLIEQEVFLLHQQLETINSQIEAYGLLVADKQEELDQAQLRLAKLNVQNKERIRAMEKNGGISYWSVLFKANTFIDLLDRLKTIQQIAKADAQRMEQMQQAAQEVASAKEALQSQLASFEETKQELTATQQEVQARQEEAQQLLDQLIAKGDEFNQMLEQSEEAQERLAAELAKAESDYEDAKYQQWLSTSETTRVTEPPKPTVKPTQPTVNPTQPTVNPTQPTASSESTESSEPEETTEPDEPTEPSQDSGNAAAGVRWVVPCRYIAMTSPFGYRWHPISGKWKMHNGVDLAAPRGTPIVATRSGRVKVASYEQDGAGYYVSLDHGDGYGSIYMHMTHYIVAEGDQVKAGQVIGYVGSTGGSTGNHLHFGISYKGTYVNPADYIDI